MRQPIRVALAVFFLTWISASHAQVTTATISGTVSDSTGAVLPGAKIVVLNEDTGISRTVQADSAGRYAAPALSLGNYRITASPEGFQSAVRSGIVLTVGREAVVNFQLNVGAVTQTVEVTGEAPLLNTSSSAVAGVVDQRRIQELPLNGRDFSQLPLVQPGVTAVRNGDSTVTKGYGARVSMGGSRPDQTAWLLDGTSIRSQANFGTPGSAAGVMLGVDAVREFQVLTSNYSAELGGTSGGVVNMITKSGTNELHGTAYEFLRNSALDARNFFDQEKGSFKRNQYGASAGGAIKKDRMFFFGNYEGLRQRLGVTNVPTVPDANVHQGLIPAAGGGLQRVTVAPEIRPYLDLWPLPNGPAVGGGLATLFAPGNSRVDESFFVVRVDQHINDRQSLFARFTYDQGTLVQPDPVPVTATSSGIHTRYTTLQHDYIVSPQFLMTTRIAYNRTLQASSENPLINYSPSLNLFLPGFLPTLGFPGVTTMGPTTTNATRRAQNLYDIEEALQYIHGSHSMKFGVQIEHAGYNPTQQPASSNGAFTWSTLQDFLLDSRLNSFAAGAPGSDPSRSYVQYVYGTYFQDDWKMRPNFTWNLGLRYEPFTSPSEKHGRLSMLKDWVHDTAFDTHIGFFKSPSKKNFSPRVGFAWDPSGNGKTAVRGGFGLFFVDLLGAYFLGPAKNPPFAGSTASVLGNLASAPADMARIGPGLLSPVVTPVLFVDIINWNLNSSYEMKYNFTVERQLPGNFSVSAGYLGNRGVHLWRLTDANDVPPILVNGRPFVVAGTPRLNQNLGAATIRYSDAQSFYNGLQIELKRRFSHGFQLQSAYTWAKNIDDSTTGVALTDFNEGAGSQAYNPKVDRGLSALSQSQTLVINGVYLVPSPIQSGFVSHFLGGWQLSSIFSVSSGTPFSPRISGRSAPDQSRSTGGQRPDLVAGRSFSSIVLGDPNQYFDPKAFVLPPPPPPGFPAGSGFYGNAGRNILIGPGFENFDLSLMKNTPLKIKEGDRLEFRAEFFNLFNRANFAVPSSLQVLNPANGQYIAGAGKISKTVSSSRQMQFGLKLIF